MKETGSNSRKKTPHKYYSNPKNTRTNIAFAHTKKKTTFSNKENKNIIIFKLKLIKVENPR